VSRPPALLIIDVQQGLDDAYYGARNNPAAEHRMAELLAAWRAAGHPVLHAQHQNSAFVGTGLESHLRANGIEALVIAGLTTDHCVSSTARMAANLGFRVTVVADATATFDRTGPDGEHFSADVMHRAALASLHQEFAMVLSSSEVLATMAEAG